MTAEQGTDAGREEGIRSVTYALVSDIHGNLPALEAVLADIDSREGVDAIYHLGDLVGYAPWPNEVVETLQRRAIAGVAGNYDSTTATDHHHCGCRYEDPEQEELSHQSYAWTRAEVRPAVKRWLGGLPFRIDLRPRGGHAPGPRLVLVHGNPILNTVYWTEDRSDDFCRRMARHLGVGVGDVVAFGHTHLPWHRVVDGIHFVNTGSVGRPKDGDPRAGYVLLSFVAPGVVANGRTGPGGPPPAAKPSAEFIRVPYDVERAASAIRAGTLPDAFAAYLERGGPGPRAAGEGE